MKKILLSLAFIGISAFSFGQFTTNNVTLGGSGMTIRIDTNTTTVSLTLTGPDTSWLGIGFGATNMNGVRDYFIWSSNTNRDYFTNTGSGRAQPSIDPVQNWTINSDVASGGIRTINATRNLVSTGDYSFINSTASIPIIYAVSNTTTFGEHQGEHSSFNLTRTALGVEDFSLNATAIYPNPSTGVFNVQTKTSLDKINVYSQIGAFVKTIENIEGANNIEINLKGLQSGVYLLELQNATEKSWKKIVIE